ncbi:MAG: hypothetical protein DMF62_00315 [Acidobacteria bacterium]|nr:MAG: hypothetical protein DMF62_00315 [Acidobacteriota bacterium]
MFTRSIYLLVLVFTLAAAVAAQDPPSPVPIATPFAVDKNGIAPDKVTSGPPVASSFRSTDRALPDLGRVGVDLADQKPLTLNEAIVMALESNRDIEVTRKTVLMAEFDLKAARGVYEPRFSGLAYYENATIPNISFFNPTTDRVQSKNFAGNIGLQAYVPSFGTSITATLDNQRVGTDNLVQIISPQYNSNLRVTVTQPLFRGRGFDQPRRAIEIAKSNLSLTDAQFRQRAIEIVAAAQRAYWDLTYALRNLQVQRDAVRDAKAQLEHNRRLVEEGQLAPVDVLAAETQVANFEQSVYDALNTVTVAENALKNIVSANRAEGIWSKSITPVDSVDLDVPTTTLPEALDAALQNRPELQINQTQKKINAIDQKYFRDQQKPQIDLVASYTSTGVGGSLNPNFINPFCRDNPQDPACQQALQALLRLVGGAGSTWGDILANKYPTYRVGVQFNLPLFGNKTADAQYGRSLVEGDRLNVVHDQLEQNIQVEVRNALQFVRTAEARLRSASISRENSEKQYESEQRKLDSGQSDIYRVLERQTALTTARSNELRAQTELNKSIADLQRATGNSLKANNVEPVLKK